MTDPDRGTLQSDPRRRVGESAGSERETKRSGGDGGEGHMKGRRRTWTWLVDKILLMGFRRPSLIRNLYGRKTLKSPLMLTKRRCLDYLVSTSNRYITEPTNLLYVGYYINS